VAFVGLYFGVRNFMRAQAPQKYLKKAKPLDEIMPRQQRPSGAALLTQLRPKLPKLATFLDEVETDVLAYMTFPRARSWLASSPTCRSLR
jgi:hypothetical protein